MSAIPPFSLGFVGSGGMARHRAERFERLDTYRLRAVASRNRETGQALADAHGMAYLSDWRSLIEREDIDAVVICTHNDSHGEIALASLEANKHVFMEYPLARDLEQGERAVVTARDRGKVIRLTHSENVSPMHARLRQVVQDYGPLRVATFSRLTPGRGARPEVLFNLKVSGPPALFFIYHVYPVIDLFGEAAWVEGSAFYEALDEQKQTYQSFVNDMRVGFRQEGLGHWLWAGGIEISEAEEHRRYILAGGTLMQRGASWILSRRSGLTELAPVSENFPSLEELFCKDMLGEPTHWQQHAQVAFQAIRVSLAAERSMQQNQRITF